MKRDGYSTLGVIFFSVVGIWIATGLDDFGSLRSPKVLLAFLGLSLLMIGPAVLWVPSKLKTGLAAVYVIVVLVMPAARWTSRKAFLVDLDRIQPGMTVAQVEEIMKPYMVGSGWPADPSGSRRAISKLHDVGTNRTYDTSTSPAGELSIDRSVIYRHSNEGAYDSDWGIVEFRDGRVARVTFSPD